MVAKTRWDDYITASLTLFFNDDSASAKTDGLASTRTPSPQWVGVLELRSTAINTQELEKYPLDVIRIFTGGVLERAISQATSIGQELSLSTPIVAMGSSDPFVTTKPETTPSFTADFQPVETRLPQGVSFETHDWMNPSVAQQKPASFAMGVTASSSPAAADPWL